MRRTSSAMALVFVFAMLCLVAACRQKAPEAPKSEVTSEDVKKEAREAVEAAGQYGAQKKEEFEKEAEERLKELDGQIDELAGRVKVLGGEAGAGMKEAMDGLKAKRDAARKKLDELRGPTAAAWEDVKAGAQEAMQDLEAAYRDALSRFESTGKGK